MNDYSEYENQVVNELAKTRKITWKASFDLCGTVYGFLMMEGYTSGKSASDVANAIDTFSEA